jgi:hypothetical protein
MRARQRGATFLGMVVIIAILGFGLYAGIRLTPLYIEYMAVTRAMTQAAEGTATGPNDLRNTLERRWIIEDIKSIQPKDIDIKKANEGYTMRAWYRAEAPFIANISLVVEFDKTVQTK